MYFIASFEDTYAHHEVSQTGYNEDHQELPEEQDEGANTVHYPNTDNVGHEQSKYFFTASTEVTTLESWKQLTLCQLNYLGAG